MTAASEDRADTQTAPRQTKSIRATWVFIVDISSPSAIVHGPARQSSSQCGDLLPLRRARPGRAARARRVADVVAVLLVLAEHLEDVVVGDEVVRDLDRERLYVDLRVVEGHLDVEVAEVAAPETLGDAQCV